MKFKLDCSNKYKDYVRDNLIKVGFEVTDDAHFMIVNNPLKTFGTPEPFEDYKSIIFLESFANELHIHTLYQKQPIVIQGKLFEVEERYKEEGFIRVNKSQIANIRHISSIEPWIGQKYLLTMCNKAQIDVNRTYYKAFRAYLEL